MLALLLTVLLAAAPKPGEAANADSVRYEVRLGDAAIGRCLWITLPDSAGGATRRETTRIEIRRGDQAITLSEEADWSEDPEGSLRSVRLVRSGMGPDVWNDRLVRLPAGWRRERARAGRTEVDTLAGGPLLGPVAIERLLASEPDSARVRSVDTESMRPTTYRIVRLRGDTLDAGFHRVPCTLFAVRDSAMEEAGSGTILQWRDRQGAIWRERDEGLGSSIERDEVDKEESPARKALEGGLDAIAWRPLAIDGEPPQAPPCALLMLPDSSVAGERAGGATPPVPDEPGQSVTAGDAPDSWRILIDRESAGLTTAQDRARWREQADLAPCIESDLIVDAGDPSVRDFAQRAVRIAQTPTEEALALERAVHERIAIRDLGTVFATASQTLRAGRGDCTEHAVLLAACCRARGIPARLVAGIVPTPGRMLFHLWTEVFLNRWTALDATLGSGSAAPCAIALMRWEHPEEGIASFNQSFVRIAGHYKFRVEDRAR